MTYLGELFLTRYYSLVQTAGSSVVLVADVGGQVVGFVAGYLEPAAFYGVLRSHKVRLAVSALPALLGHPRLFPRVLGSFRRTAPSVQPRESCCAELASLAVDPDWAAQGIGSRLVKAFLDLNHRAGKEAVYLTTDAEQNDAVNRFYAKLGFAYVRSLHASGDRLMNEYRFTFRGK